MSARGVSHTLIQVGRSGRSHRVKRSLSGRALHVVFSRVNRKRPWYELPSTALKSLNLLSLRLDLRDMNLFDTGTPIRKHGLEEPPREALGTRRPDGTW